MADAVGHDAEEWREEGAQPHQRAEQDELLHGAGGGEHVPAEDERLHLERERGEEVGGPLEAEAADAKRGQGRRTAGPGIRGHRRMLQGLRPAGGASRRALATGAQDFASERFASSKMRIVRATSYGPLRSVSGSHWLRCEGSKKSPPYTWIAPVRRGIGLV